MPETLSICLIAVTCGWNLDYLLFIISDFLACKNWENSLMLGMFISSFHASENLYIL